MDALRCVTRDGNTRPACLRDLDATLGLGCVSSLASASGRVGRAPNVRNKPFHYSIGEVRRVCCAAILRQEEFHFHSFICCCCCGKGDFNGRTGWAWAIKNWVEISQRCVWDTERERSRAGRQGPVMAATRTPLRVSNLPLDLRMELRGRSGLAIVVVVVVVVDAGQGQVQGDCVFLLSQVAGCWGWTWSPRRGPA